MSDSSVRSGGAGANLRRFQKADPAQDRDREETVAVEFPASFFRRLEGLALRHDRTVSDLVQHAVNVQFSDDAVTARLRLVDRLARLEARLGDVDSLLEDVARESRVTRAGSNVRD